MPFLIYVVLMCLCAVKVTGDWSPVWSVELPPGGISFAAFDPSYPDLIFGYTKNGWYGCAVNVTTGTVLWSLNWQDENYALLSAAVRGGVLFSLTSYVYGYLNASNALTGQLEWSDTTTIEWSDDATIEAPQGTELLMVLNYFAVYAVNSTNGNVVWSFYSPVVGPPQYYRGNRENTRF